MDLDDRQDRNLITAGLNLIAQALSIYDRDLRLAVCNRRFKEMFDLPEALVTPGARFADTIRHLVEIGEYGEVDEIETFVQARVDQALAFEPHYVERTRSNGMVISIEGAPLAQGGWVAVYTDITRTRRSEQLLRARSAELSDQLLSHAEELSAANRKLAASNLALTEAKRQISEIELRTRMTTEMMPAHIAHVDARGRYTYSNRRLSAVIPGRPSEILGMTIADALGPAAFDRVEPHLLAAYRGESPVFEFNEDHDQRRIRVAFTPDGEGGVYILSMDVTEETQARVALQQTRRRALAAQMTSGLAHDFSNLLTIILGVQSRLEKLDLPDEARPGRRNPVRRPARRPAAEPHRRHDRKPHPAPQSHRPTRAAGRSETAGHAQPATRAGPVGGRHHARPALAAGPRHVAGRAAEPCAERPRCLWRRGADHRQRPLHRADLGRDFGLGHRAWVFPRRA